MPLVGFPAEVANGFPRRSWGGEHSRRIWAAATDTGGEHLSPSHTRVSVVYSLNMSEPEAGDEPFVVEITDSIDLHHFRPSEVLDVVDAYLDAALEKGFLEVRLIHGRGKGVQRARVQRRLGGDERVDRFEEAPPGRGGWGATIVWLKRS